MYIHTQRNIKRRLIRLIISLVVYFYLVGTLILENIRVTYRMIQYLTG